MAILLWFVLGLCLAAAGLAGLYILAARTRRVVLASLDGMFATRPPAAPALPRVAPAAPRPAGYAPVAASAD